MHTRRKSKNNADENSHEEACIGNIVARNELSAERRAQVDCVLHILKDSIKKIKISLILSQILFNPYIFIDEHAADAKLTDFCTTLQEYLEDVNSTDENEHYLNPKIIDLMELFNKNLSIVDFWPNCHENITTDDLNVIDGLSLLYKVIELRLPKTALSELNREKKLNKLQNNIGCVEKLTKELSEKLRKETIARRWKLALKAALIHKYEEDLAFRKWDNNMRIKQEIVKSSKVIQSLHDSSSIKLQDLELEAITKRDAYSKLLRKHLISEKEARTEKNKLLFQLQSYIKKYDQNVGDKIKENLHLQENYNQKKNEFDTFMVEYKTEEEEFFTIVHQKEQEEQLLFEQKLMVFMMYRAARVIQMYWRRYRRDQKKKGKKGKGKGKKK